MNGWCNTFLCVLKKTGNAHVCFALRLELIYLF